MELINLKDVCFQNKCITCPLYDDEECMLEHCPIKWDLEEIERRLKKLWQRRKKLKKNTLRCKKI